MTIGKRFSSLLLIGALNFLLVPAVFAQDTTDTTVEASGPCAEFHGGRKFACLRRHRRRAAKETCSSIEDPRERHECLRRERKASKDKFKEKHPKFKRKVRRRVGHEFKERCAELRGWEKRDCIRGTLKDVKEKRPGVGRKIRRRIGKKLKDRCAELWGEERRDCVRGALKEKLEKRKGPGRRLGRRLGHKFKAHCGELRGNEKRGCIRDLRHRLRTGYDGYDDEDATENEDDDEDENED